MSSPIIEGTIAGSAFSSRDVNILSETIWIRIDKDFNTAKYTVEYEIQSDLTGTQIPLLFIAQDYKDSFYVWFDNQKVTVQHIPEKYLHFENSPFLRFSNLKDPDSRDKNADYVTVYWDKNGGYVYNLHELQYFETSINKGIHKIRVEYIAQVRTDISGWIRKYSFRYSLTPAKFWKSFGDLKVIVEQEGQARPLTTNLGQPLEKDILQKNTWLFNQLPDEYIDITFNPQPNSMARMLLAIEPIGITLIVGLLLIILHVVSIRLYRVRNRQKKYSLAVIAGSLIIPFLCLLAYVYAHYLIDYSLGEEAGRRHGYVFLVMLLYPIFLPIYGAIMWYTDKRWFPLQNKQAE